MRENREITEYEKMNPNNMDKTINKLGRKTTIYFIGFCTFFIMAFFYSITIHYFFTVLIAFLFTGFLLVYYMITYVFVRLVRMLQFNDKFLSDMLDNDEHTNDNKDTIEDREEIPKI